MFPFLVLLFSLQQQSQSMSAAAVSLTCGVRDAQTSSRSRAGYTATLKMHSEDDHAKDSHLCRADYTLDSVKPNAAANSPFQFFSSNDEWDRPIAFRIDGFSRDGAHVFVFIAENNFPGSIEIVEYDMKSASRVREIFLESSFTRRLSRACSATLHVVGTSAVGRVVLGTSTKEECNRKGLWELGPNRTASSKGVVLPDFAKPLTSRKGILPLERGTPVQAGAKPEPPPHSTD
jgi:hypothetical protein